MVSREKWAEVIKDFHEKNLPKIIPRMQEIGFESDMKRAVSIIGPRRTGKTYEMYYLISKIKDKFGIDRAVYINFERADFGILSYKDLVLMLETYYELYPKNKKEAIWLFLDEIQNVVEWERFVRTCLDDGIRVFLSGSSSKLLSKEIATSMRGRNISYNIYPFSFVEYLITKKFEIGKFYSSSEKSTLKNLFNEYLIFGGYPESIIYSNEREKIIKDIFDTAIYKDVIERNKVRNVNVMRLLIKVLLNSKEFSINKFYNYIKSQGIKVSKNALYNYSEYLGDAFFVFFLRKYDLSIKKREQSLPKIYFIDNGFLTLNGIEDKGRLLENLVFMELTRRNKDISYYQNSLKEEVDFLVKEGKKVKQLIQVCYDLSNFMTLDREIRVLIKASKEFECNNLVIISLDEEREEKVNGRVIKIIPVWKWLLE
ncbi:MAG: ATP-binding protein [Nanoarchaeota archaeon]